jgi:hypothetical protein
MANHPHASDAAAKVGATPPIKSRSDSHSAPDLHTAGSQGEIPDALSSTAWSRISKSLPSDSI